MSESVVLIRQQIIMRKKKSGDWKWSVRGLLT